VNLEPDEMELFGNWIVVDGRVRGDETEARIYWLTANSLNKLAATPDGWDRLFQDPADGRYWEHTYPRSEMQGGGPQKLTCISKDEAVKKYGIDSL
jgi:hypothetical protein